MNQGGICHEDLLAAPDPVEGCALTHHGGMGVILTIDQGTQLDLDLSPGGSAVKVGLVIVLGIACRNVDGITDSRRVKSPGPLRRLTGIRS